MLGHPVERRVLRVAAIVTVVALTAIAQPARAAAPAPRTAAGPSHARDRLAARKALADAGRAPRFPTWRRGELRSADGEPMPAVSRPFDGWTVSVRRTGELYPPTIADPARWGAVQEQLLPVGECACSGASGLPGAVPETTLRVGRAAGSLSFSRVPAVGSRYFLVVPLTPDDEGRFGDVVSRPPATMSCRFSALESCP